MASAIFSIHRGPDTPSEQDGSGSRRLSPEAMAAATFLVVLLIFGGTSADHAGINLVLEGLSLAVLLMTVLLASKLRPMSGARGLGVIALFLLLIYAVQLVPLPPQAWSAVPGRALIVRGYELLQVALPWRPLSLSPGRTMASATALLPGLCALNLTLRVPSEDFRVLSYAIIAVSIVSVLFGIAQVVGGEGASLNWHNAVGDSAHGFFANPNHLSTLLLTTIPMLFAAAQSSLTRDPAYRKLISIVVAAVTLFLIFGIMASESTGGLVLLLPTLLASSLLLKKSQPGKTILFDRRWPIVAAGVLIAVSGPFVLIVLSNREISWGTSLGSSDLDRLGIARTAFAAAVQYWPFGSGMGTFPLVYPAHENLSSVSNLFINHVHNEYLELLFESGILGAALIAAVLVWWVRCTTKAWQAEDRFAPWTQASSIAIAIIAVHSGFDYPARTPALLALGAAFCAILARRTGFAGRSNDQAARP